jgi:hypothetical protein
MTGFYLVSRLHFDQRFILFVGIEGLALFDLEVKLHLSGCIINAGCDIVVSVEAFD